MNGEHGNLALIVRQMTVEADDVLSVVLVAADGADLPEWTVGAHIDLVLPGSMVRQYSLCGDPSVRSEYKIAVLNEPESLGGSRYVHEILRPGGRIDVGAPRNNFPLVPAPSYLVVAGGIGVTPLLPLVQALEDARATWALLYGGRRRASMAFLGELDRFGAKVVVRPEDEFGLLDLAEAIVDTSADTAIYCCGPEGLIAAVEALCEQLGRPAPHVERFKARPGHAQELEARALVDAPFEVVLARSGQSFVVPVGKTIMDVLRANGVFVTSSCTEGYCGVCATAVLEGVPDHRDDFLTPETRATNKTVMLCCSRSQTPQLVLKL